MMKAQGMGGVTQRQIKQIFQSTSKEDRLIGELQRAFAMEDAARRQWIATLGQQEGMMLKNIQQMHTDFVNKLNATLNQINAANQPPPPPPGAPPGGWRPNSMVPGMGYPTSNQTGNVPGGPKGKDDDLVWMDREGEAIINARSTKKYRGLLEAINSDSYAQSGKCSGLWGGVVCIARFQGSV